MQNVAQGSTTDNQKLEKVNVQHGIGKSSTPISSNSSPTKSETETFSELQPRFMTDSSESEEEDVSEVILSFCNNFIDVRVASRRLGFNELRRETSCGIVMSRRQCRPSRRTRLVK